MRRVLYSLIAIAGISALCLAQDPAAPQTGAAAPQGTTQAAGNQAGAPNQIAAGTVIPAELSKSVDAKKSKSGDKVEAKTAMDLLSHGPAPTGIRKEFRVGAEAGTDGGGAYLEASAGGSAAYP